MPMELTEDQLAQIYQRAQNMASNAAGGNAPLVISALGRQMADSPSRNEITLKIGITFRCLFNTRWELDCNSEWERKIKEKDSLGTETIDFEQPELPFPATKVEAAEAEAEAIRRAIDVTARPVLMLGPIQPEDERCLCGHLRHVHRDNDGEAGGCNLCVCEVFETEEDGPQAIEETKPQPELPAVTVTNEADPIGEINDLDGYAAGEPTVLQIKADLLGMFDDQPHLGRNLAKFKAAGYTVVTPLLNFEKCLLKLESGKWDLHRFDTKTACASGLKSFLDCGSIYLCDPNFKDRATGAGFYLLRLRTDGIYSKGKKGIGWCKESDARGEKAKEEMAVLAQDPKALED